MQSPESPPTPLHYAVAATDRVAALSRRPTHPVGWLFVTLTFILAIFTLYAVSGPAAYFFPSLEAIALWFIVAVTWLVRTAAAILPRPLPVRPSKWLPTLAIPLMLLVTIALIAEDVPSQFAFAIGVHSMERTARVLLNQPDGTSIRTRIGIYGTCDFTRDQNVVTASVPGAGFMDSYGFAYCPAGNPSGSGRFTPINGPWYRWFEKF